MLSRNASINTIFLSQNEDLAKWIFIEKELHECSKKM